MKILYPFIGDSLGGSHKSAIDYIIELKKKIFELIILLLKKNSILEKYLNSKGLFYEFISLPVISLDRNILKKFYAIFLGYFKARRYLKKNKIDIVHTNDIKNHFCWSIWSIFNSKHIWHQRTMWPRSIQFFIFIIFANKVLCNSNYLKKNINYNFIKKKLYYLPNIIYQNKSNYLKKSKNKLIIGSFSNIQNIKRPDILAKLADQIYKKKLNIEIHCYGTDKSNLLNKYLKSIYLKTFFKKFGQKLDVIKHMKKCDIIVATSEKDALGRSILESMSLGIPVFATNAGGHKEIIQNKKKEILFNIKKTNNLLDQILDFKKNHSLVKKIIMNGLNSIKKFNSNKITSDLIEIYEKKK